MDEKQFTDAKCEKMYLHYFNEFLTLERFAEYYQLETSTAMAIIDRGRQINHSPKPERKISFCKRGFSAKDFDCAGCRNGVKKFAPVYKIGYAKPRFKVVKYCPDCAGKILAAELEKLANVPFIDLPELSFEFEKKLI